MQKQTYNNNKIANKLLKILMVFLVILFILAYSKYAYLKKQESLDYKSKFLKYVSKNDLKFFIKNELVEQLIEKIENSNYILDSNFKLFNSNENQFLSDVDISKFNFNMRLTSNYNNSKKYYINAKYLGNDFLTVNFINNKTNYAIKSEEIFDKYIGIGKENVQEFLDKSETISISLADFDEISDFVSKRKNYKLSEITKIPSLKSYEQTICEQIEDGKYSMRENIVIKQEDVTKNVIEYSLKLSAAQFSRMLKQLSQNIESDSDLTEFFVTGQETPEIKTDYKDNDSVITIPANANNANAFEISSNIEEFASVSNEIDNTIIIENQINNQINNQISNHVDNQITNQISNIINNEITNTISLNEIHNSINILNNNNTITNDTTNRYINILMPEDATNEIVEEEPIVEEDNFRFKGFISLNDNIEVDYSGDNDNFIIGENLNDTIENVKKLSDKINFLTYVLSGAKANISNNDFVEKIQHFLNDVISKKSGCEVKIYVNDGKVIKYVFELPEVNENFSVEIFSKNDKEKYLNINYFKGMDQGATGKNITIYKKYTSAQSIYTININNVINNKVSQKNKLNFEVTGNMKDKQIPIVLEFSRTDANGTVKVQTDNKIIFDGQFAVEELDDENCFFIDNAENEETNLLIEEIKSNVKSVLNEKNRNLNIISVNSSGSTIEHSNEIKASDSSAKDDARKIIVDKISIKMREYLDAGKNLELADLKDFQIEGHNVQIVLNSNLAIIKIDGYTFNLDKNFNLSDG